MIIPELETIFNNRTSGSMEIVSMINKLIRENMKQRDKLKSIIDKAEMELSHFGAVKDYINHIKKIIYHGDLIELNDYTSKYLSDISASINNIYINTKPLLKKVKKIFTLSNSTTLAELFKLMHRDNPSISIIVSESRPLFEGRIMAKVLLRNNIKVEFMPEVLMAKGISGSDAVIIGADIILKNGGVVNKSGSRIAAMLAKDLNKPFYVVASSNKFTKEKRFSPKPKAAEEVWKFKHPNLYIYNEYFEKIESNLVTKIITDKIN